MNEGKTPTSVAGPDQPRQEPDRDFSVNNAADTAFLHKLRLRAEWCAKWRGMVWNWAWRGIKLFWVAILGAAAVNLLNNGWGLIQWTGHHFPLHIIWTWQ